MNEPRTRVVGLEADCHIVRGIVTDGDNIANDRVVPVVSRVTSAADNPEVVAVQVHRVLKRELVR